MMKSPLCILVLFIAACASNSPRQSMTTVSPCEAYVGRPAPGNFIDFDVDGNGKVSRDEFQCQLSEVFNRLDKDDDDFVSTKELKAHKLFKTTDQNKDGRLSIIEFMWAAENAMSKADGDKDGSLSAQEYGRMK